MADAAVQLDPADTETEAAPPKRLDLIPRGLGALEAKLRRDLDILDYPARPWVPPRTTRSGEPILNALIVGGGQGGLAVAFGLMREKVDRVLVVDAQPRDREGPWLRFARMKTLRTPKHVLGPDQGIPDLSIHAWYEAQHGPGSWEAVGFVPRETWARYIGWYRDFLGIPVRSETRVGAMRWNEDDQCFDVPVETRTDEGTKAETLHARKVVLATGIEGSGQWFVPEVVKGSLPETRWAHTHERIDFDALKGKRVAVLGAGASAFDNASVALENGAASVDLYFRREELVRVNVYRWAEFVGFLHHHGDLDDATKYRFIHRFFTAGQLPPAPTFERATKHETFQMHPGSPWEKTWVEDEVVKVRTPHGVFEHDYVICGTGFRTDLASRPELSEVEQHIARWADRFTPPEGEAIAELLRHPYLGPSFEMTARDPEAAPWLKGLFNYNFGCLLSLGLGGASISGMKYSVRRIVGGITKQLYLEDAATHLETLAAYDEKDF
ncbi:MAG TPA: NAD(P)/FAD-dependent oxidoreductase [Polyangiaceae bacterium LLY-WYZ-15_(1-7)]|nr:NAD(P)/FAD-dependent oxidoreductase [Polyangiaceae bacterium LLY-WYZ-15_(1-7)]